jgi:hypothetical protein
MPGDTSEPAEAKPPGMSVTAEWARKASQRAHDAAGRAREAAELARSRKRPTAAAGDERLAREEAALQSPDVTGGSEQPGDG